VLLNGCDSLELLEYFSSSCKLVSCFKPEGAINDGAFEGSKAPVGSDESASNCLSQFVGIILL